MYLLVNDIDLPIVPSSVWLKRLAVGPQRILGAAYFYNSGEYWLGTNDAVGRRPEAVIVQEAAKGGITSFGELETYYGVRGPWNQVPGSENGKKISREVNGSPLP